MSGAAQVPDHATDEILIAIIAGLRDTKPVAPLTLEQLAEADALLASAGGLADLLAWANATDGEAS